MKKGQGDKGHQKGKSDSKAKEKMERENLRKDMTKGKAKLTFDPRAKDVVTSKTNR